MLTQLERVHPQRQPYVLGDRESEPLGHHADDRRLLAVHARDPTHDLGVASETVLPHVVA
jgi:hypothetical protein